MSAGSDGTPATRFYVFVSGWPARFLAPRFQASARRNGGTQPRSIMSSRAFSIMSFHAFWLAWPLSARILASLLGSATLFTLWLRHHILSQAATLKKANPHMPVEAVWNPLRRFSILVYLEIIPRSMLRYTQGWRWKSKHESFEELKSDVFAVVNTWSAYVTIADADLIKEAASRRVEIPKPTQEYRAFNIFGSNILTTEGDEWRKHRKIVSPHFSETNNLLVHHETQRLVAEMCEEWETTAVRAPDSPDEFQVNVSQDMSRLTLFVFSAAGFGRKLSWSVRDQPDEGHRYSFEQVIGLVLKNLALNFFLPKWIFKLPIDPFRTIGRQFDEFEQYVRRMARQAQDQVSEKPDNLLEAIVGASVQDDEHNAVRLTEDEVVGDIFIFLLAGHDTTATTLTFALTLLGFHRDKQERLYQEVVGHLAASNGDGDGDGISDSDGAAATASYKDCSSIEYVSAIMNETLRLFPPVTSVFKVCEVDQNLGGYWIPKGTRVDLNAVGLHYNRRYWGPDPAEFRPERFLPPNTWNRAALIPFSAGARSCVGKRFSQVEFAAALVHLVQRYEWRVAPGVSEACLQEASGIILKMKRPPPILFKRRSTAQ